MNSGQINIMGNKGFISLFEGLVREERKNVGDAKEKNSFAVRKSRYP